MEKKSFKDMFTGFTDDGLWKRHQGPQDHEHIDLCTWKAFTFSSLTQKIIVKVRFMQLCDVYMEMKPFRDYLNQAVTV
jgi:hypothetical protein